MKKTFCLDTNILLYDPNAIYSFEENDVVIPFVVLEELDDKKTRADDVGKNARQTSRILDELRKQGDLSKGVPLPNGGTLRVALDHAWNQLPVELQNESADNRIISTALGSRDLSHAPTYLITKDINMRIKCDMVGLKCDDYKKHRVAKGSDLVYGGVSVTSVDAQTLGKFFSDKKLPIESTSLDPEKLFANEFIVLKNNGSGSGLARFKNGELKKVVEYESKDLWGIAPRNKEQRFALDILMDDDVKLVSLIGAAGTGKTLMAIAAGLSQVLESKTYSKLIVTKPIQPVGRDIGYLPGTKEEKMEPWIQPIIDNLEYLFGCRKRDNVLSMYFENGIIEVEAITYIRGRSIPNAYIIIDEAQNLSVHELKTIVTRAGEGTKIVLTGDIDQIDNSLIDAVSNGLTYAVEKFKSYEIAGHITLLKGERSQLATLASEIL